MVMRRERKVSSRSLALATSSSTSIRTVTCLYLPRSQQGLVSLLACFEAMHWLASTCCPPSRSSQSYLQRIHLFLCPYNRLLTCESSSDFSNASRSDLSSRITSRPPTSITVDAAAVASDVAVIPSDVHSGVLRCPLNARRPLAGTASRNATLRDARGLVAPRRWSWECTQRVACCSNVDVGANPPTGEHVRKSIAQERATRSAFIDPR